MDPAAQQNRGAWYMPVGWTCTSLAIIAVTLRFYTRVWLTRSVGSDDFAMILPIISTVGGQIVDTMSNLEGYGRHARFLSNTSLETIEKHTYIAWIRAFISYFFLRASIMLFTLRLLPFNKKFARRVIYVAFGLNFAITLIACVCYGVKCTPFRAAYAEVPGSTCRSNQMLIASQIVNGVLACVIDVATALIPAFLLWDLQMKRKTKICLNIIFLLGLFTAALSIARAATTTSTTYGDDLTYTSVIPGVMSAVEEKMGIFFASCPMLRQFVTYVLRTHSFLPTATPDTPNRDFIAMRKRVKLRDIFWYRKRTPNDVTPAPGAPPNKPQQIDPQDKDVKVSAMDRIWKRIGWTKKPDRVSLVDSEKGLVGDPVKLKHAEGWSSDEGSPPQIGRERGSSGGTFLMSETRHEEERRELGTVSSMSTQSE